MDNLRERRADRWSGLGWIVLGTVVIVMSARMEVPTHLGATFMTGPGFVPALIGAALCVLGLVLILRASWGRVDAFLDAPGTAATGRAMLALAVMSVFALGLVGRVPFGWAAAGFVTAFIVIFNLPAGSPSALARLVAKAAATGAVTAVAIVVLFERIFLVRLP